MLDKNYDAASVEPRIASLWDSAAAFKAGAGAKECRALFHRYSAAQCDRLHSIWAMR